MMQNGFPTDCPSCSCSPTSPRNALVEVTLGLSRQLEHPSVDRDTGYGVLPASPPLQRLPAPHSRLAAKAAMPDPPFPLPSAPRAPQHRLLDGGDPPHEPPVSRKEPPQDYIRDIGRHALWEPLSRCATSLPLSSPTPFPRSSRIPAPPISVWGCPHLLFRSVWDSPRAFSLLPPFPSCPLPSHSTAARPPPDRWGRERGELTAEEG